MAHLVLSRAIGEVIMVGDDVEITDLDFKGKEKVRLGIKAPPHVPVHRKEIFEAIHKKEKGEG